MKRKSYTIRLNPQVHKKLLEMEDDTKKKKALIIEESIIETLRKYGYTIEEEPEAGSDGRGDSP